MKKEQKHEIVGLKRLRKSNGSKPSYYCSNCRCYRYSPCTCQRKVVSK